MPRFVAAAAALAATALCVPTPVQAAACWGPQAVSAAKLRNLDIMLEATARRCRSGADDFQADYHAFAAAHQGTFDAADIVLRGQLADGGADDPRRALETMSVAIASGYGAGHPELGCRELRVITRDLARSEVPGVLIAAADALVGTPAIAAQGCNRRVATMRR